MSEYYPRARYYFRDSQWSSSYARFACAAAEGGESAMTIDVVRSGEVAVVGVAGRVTSAGAGQLLATVRSLVSTGINELTVHLDISRCPDAAFLRMLRQARKQLAGDDRDLVVSSAQSSTRSMLALVGLSDASPGPGRRQEWPDARIGGSAGSGYRRCRTARPGV
jgi:anti-anti-sigma regulatory factor